MPTLPRDLSDSKQRLSEESQLLYVSHSVHWILLLSPCDIYITAILALSQGSHNIWLRLYSSFLPPHVMVLHSLTTRCVPVHGAPPCIDVWSIILDPISCPPPHEALHGSHSQMLQTQSIGAGGGVMQAEERSILSTRRRPDITIKHNTTPNLMVSKRLLADGMLLS